MPKFAVNDLFLRRDDAKAKEIRGKHGIVKALPKKAPDKATHP